MSEESDKKPEPEVETEGSEVLSTTPSDVRQALKELASAVAKHDVQSSPEVDKALEGLASAVAGREATEDDRRALVEFASDIGLAVHEPQQELAQDGAEDAESLVDKVKALLAQAAEAVASRPSGQLLLRHADAVLKVVELSAVWEQGDGTEKPMPWMLLVPMLLLLKMIRCGVGVAAPLLGLDSPTLKDMIRFIRKQRRNMRAMKYAGMKNMRHKARTLPESERQSLEPSLIERVCVLWPLRTLSGVASFIGLRTYPKPEKQEKKRKLDEMLRDDDEEEGTSATSEYHKAAAADDNHEEDDLNLTLTEKLDLYAEVPSDEDPDYQPESADNSSDSYEEEPESLRPTESLLVPTAVIQEDEHEGDEEEAEEEPIDGDSATTVVEVTSKSEDPVSREAAAMAAKTLPPDTIPTSAAVDPLAMTYGTPSFGTSVSSSDESNGGASANRSLLSKFLSNRRHKTAASN